MVRKANLVEGPARKMPFHFLPVTRASYWLHHTSLDRRYMFGTCDSIFMYSVESLLDKNFRDIDVVHTLDVLEKGVKTATSWNKSSLSESIS